MGCLTAGFGMGPGVTTPLLTPETVYHQTLTRLINVVIVLFGITKFDYGNQRFPISLILTPETLGLNRLRDKLAYLFVIVHMRHYTTCLSLTCLLLYALCFNVQHKQEREICSLGGEARREAKLSRTLVRRR